MTMDDEMKKIVMSTSGSLGVIDGCNVVECVKAIVKHHTGSTFYADHIYEVLLDDGRVVYTCDKIHCKYWAESTSSVQAHTSRSGDHKRRSKSYNDVNEDNNPDKSRENVSHDDSNSKTCDEVISLADSIIAASYELELMGQRIRRIARDKVDNVSPEVIEKAKKYDDIVNKINGDRG